MDSDLGDRFRGVALGAAVGDALGMPLEFLPASAPDRLVRDMLPGRLPAGSFTDDTEMALALAVRLLDAGPLNAEGLAQDFATWYRAGPRDVGLQTGEVLGRIARGSTYQSAVAAVRQARPDAAGNGSVMRCWPVAIARHRHLEQIIAESVLQSQVTHAHPECLAACVFINLAILHLVNGTQPETAIRLAAADCSLPLELSRSIMAAPEKRSAELNNTGWVRDTVESAVWSLLTTDTFEHALVQVINLGGDADTAGAVTGALAGAAYGFAAIPPRWSQALRGEWPLGSGRSWRAADLAGLADRLAGLSS